MGDASPLTCKIARWPILCSSSENRRSRLKVDSVIALSQPIRNPPTQYGKRKKNKINAPKPFRMSVCKECQRAEEESNERSNDCFKHKQGWDSKCDRKRVQVG